MNVQLVVVRPFGAYKAGAVVSDPKTMLAIRRSEHADHVVRTAVPETAAIEAVVHGNSGGVAVAADLKEG